MSRIGLGIAKAAAVGCAALTLLAGPSAAQNIGDVGRDSQGNLYTFTAGPNGTGVWSRGRTFTGPIARQRVILAERYTPTIWTDPDGCEHWVMDDGAEGYMSPHVDPHTGRPVCSMRGH